MEVSVWIDSVSWMKEAKASKGSGGRVKREREREDCRDRREDEKGNVA